MGHRMSVLGTARYCGQSPKLSSLTSQASALQGTAFHAWCADPEADATKALLARLSPEDLEQLQQWRRPDPVEVDGVELRYETAAVETTVGLDLDGEYAEPGDFMCVSVGHPDLYWHIADRGLVVVVDIKRTEFTNVDGPDSMQLHSYGCAVASKCKAVRYLTGQWSAVEGRYWWSNEMVDVWSDRAEKIRATIVAAALNDDSAHVVGAHCRGCYGREHCPAWLMPPEMAETSLRPLVAGEIIEPDEAKLRELLIATLRAEDTVTKSKNILRAIAERRGGIKDPATGKTWAPVMMPGRSSFNKELLKADGIDPKRYEKVGAEYTQMRWVKTR